MKKLKFLVILFVVTTPSIFAFATIADKGDVIEKNINSDFRVKYEKTVEYETEFPELPQIR